MAKDKTTKQEQPSADKTPAPGTKPGTTPGTNPGTNPDANPPERPEPDPTPVGKRARVTRRIVTPKGIVFEQGQTVDISDEQLEATGLKPEFYEVIQR